MAGANHRLYTVFQRTLTRRLEYLAVSCLKPGWSTDARLQIWPQREAELPLSRSLELLLQQS